MSAPIKINRSLTKLLIREVRREAERAGMKWVDPRFPDRLTRDEADNLWKAFNAHPQLRAALKSGNAKHEGVRLFAEAIQHFQRAHPQDATGAPAEWPASSSPTLPENPFGVATVEEAESFLTWAKTRPGYRAAVFDAKHPQHKQYIEELEQLRGLIHSGQQAAEPQAEAKETMSNQDAGRAEAQRAIAALRDDKEFQRAWLNKMHPGHAAAVQRREELYARAYPEPGAAPSSPAAPASSGAAPSSPAAPASSGAAPMQERIAEARRDPAYWDKHNPGHAAAVARVGALYSEASPAPAASPSPPQAAA
jgi:hypothetical protein